MHITQYGAITYHWFIAQYDAIMQKSNMLIHESHIAEHGEISNTSPIASSRPIGLVMISWSVRID